MEPSPGFSLDGFRIGHWTHPSGATGCSVLIADRPALAVVEVRGGSPGTRELALLQEGRLVQHLDAVLLTGGSAFGLAAADGVMHWLREQGRGFPTRSIPVPIVAAAVLFDLQGSDPVWPESDAGYHAAATATDEGWRSGQFGAGAGATFAKIASVGERYAGGLGAARCDTPAGSVAALVAVNAVGEVVDPNTGMFVSGPRAGVVLDQTDSSEWVLHDDLVMPWAGENTTIAVIATDAQVDRDALMRLTVAAHDGFARAIQPAHTLFDGDTVFAVATREGRPTPREVLQLSVATQRAVSQAIVRAVSSGDRRSSTDV